MTRSFAVSTSNTSKEREKKKELSEKCCSHSKNTKIRDCGFYQTDKEKYGFVNSSSILRLDCGAQNHLGRIVVRKA